MYGRILGSQRLARCPKWTPASIRSFTWTMATHCPPARRRIRRFAVMQHTRPAAGPGATVPSLGGKVKKVIVSPGGGRVKRYCGEIHRRADAPRSQAPPGNALPGRLRLPDEQDARQSLADSALPGG